MVGIYFPPKVMIVQPAVPRTIKTIERLDMTTNECFSHCLHSDYVGLKQEPDVASP